MGAATPLGCEDAPAAGRLIQASGVAPLTPGQDPLGNIAGFRAVPADFDGVLDLLGVRAPASVRPGERVELTLWFRIQETPSADAADKARVFVHALVPGGEMPAAQADHPVRVQEPMAQWKPGDIVEDTFLLEVPKEPWSDVLEVRVGWYEGKHRWRVDHGEHDGKDRVPVARLQVEGGRPAFPTATAKKRTAPVVIDGKLDEPDWARAERLGPFQSYDGKRRVKHPTWARLMWDDENLYVAFEAEDPDVFTPYEKRDDPLYDSEAVEIFIDADGDRDEYVELQAAPNDLHFDAAFKGGRRKNFETAWDHEYETRTSVDGTLNQPGDTDRGFISEWRIPIAGLRDVPAPPRVGTTWKVNLFRLDRVRRGEKVVGSEATAWSSPWSGDFHNLDRFGTLVFAE